MAESEYQLDWVTESIAVGGAPLSYEQLDRIREQGIDAIVNLCAEYCDLHAIERDHGFEVYFLPIDDEAAPDCEALEKAMEWMDGILGQQRRLLIHCRLGIGRTGTLLYSYLWSRNLHEGLNRELLDGLRARPCNFHQWRLAKRYRPSDSKQTWPLRLSKTIKNRIEGLALRIRCWFSLSAPRTHRQRGLEGSKTPLVPPSNGQPNGGAPYDAKPTEPQTSGRFDDE